MRNSVSVHTRRFVAAMSMTYRLTVHTKLFVEAICHLVCPALNIERLHKEISGHIGVPFKIMYSQFFCPGTSTWWPWRQIKTLLEMYKIAAASIYKIAATMCKITATIYKISATIIKLQQRCLKFQEGCVFKPNARLSFSQFFLN